MHFSRWGHHGPDSNFTIAISLYFKLSFDEGPIFTILYWKAGQGLKHWPFFEKLEKKCKKAKLPEEGIEPQISEWKAGLLTIRPPNFISERGKNMIID